MVTTIDQAVNKIAIEQFLNGLPQEMRVWVASQDPETPEKLADSAHSRTTGTKQDWKNQDWRNQPRNPSNRQERTQGGGTQKPKEKKPIAEVVCFKCNQKGHFARNCTGFRVCEGPEMSLVGEGEVNGQPVKRILIDSGASRTIVDRKLVAQTDIGAETISVTFGNGANSR